MGKMVESDITSERFKEIRKECGWTQEQLAFHVDMSRKSINEMERGASPIAKVTGLALSYLHRLVSLGIIQPGHTEEITDIEHERLDNKIALDAITVATAELAGTKNMARFESFDYCLYHRDCNDGAVAAWIVNEAHIMHSQPLELIAVDYKEPIPQIPDNRRVLIVDFSYPIEELIALGYRMEKVVVLDHHKTALEDLGSELNRVQLSRLDVEVTFDMDRSGAQLAWDFYHAGERRPKLIDYVGRWDLWQHEGVPDLHEVMQVVKRLPREMNLWATVAWSDMAEQLDDDFAYAEVVKRGTPLLAEYRQEVEYIAQNAFLLPLVPESAELAPQVRCDRGIHSDVGHRLLELYPDAPFAVTYYDKEGQRVFSLRSENHRADVGEICKLHGGGGHRNAASFKIKIPMTEENDMSLGSAMMDAGIAATRLDNKKTQLKTLLVSLTTAGEYKLKVVEGVPDRAELNKYLLAVSGTSFKVEQCPESEATRPENGFTGRRGVLNQKLEKPNA